MNSFDIFDCPRRSALSPIAVWFLVLCVLAACGESDREAPGRASGKTTRASASQDRVTTNDYGLRVEIRGERSVTRSWVEPEVEQVASLSEGEEYMLFNPRLARVSESGRLYVYDYGDYTVKAFTREGEYVATFGRGQGQGPGEMTMMSDVGVWRDSLVYVVDPKQRRVSFFDMDGDFLRSKFYEVPVARLAFAGDSTEYMVLSHASPSFLRITTKGRQMTISQLLPRDVHPIMLDGHLHTSQGTALFVPLYFPVILTFSPGDTTGIAYPTPDYGRPRPKAVTMDGGGIRAPADRFHLKSTLSGGVLTVENPDPETDGLKFDVYDASEMEYMRSVQLSVDGDDALYARGAGIVATVRDATVHIYAVKRREK